MTRKGRGREGEREDEGAVKVDEKVEEGASCGALDAERVSGVE